VSKKRLGLWFTVCSAAFGIATTVAAVAMGLSGEPARERLAESLMLSLSVVQVGPHDFFSIGFALVFNVVIVAAICWMTLWAASVTLTLLQRLRTTLRKSTTP
jgi:hypothetical protein